MVCFAEYIWLDGAEPTHELRSKTRLVELEKPSLNPEDYPAWSYDGSSTHQAKGKFSDLILKPVSVVKDPIRKNNSVLILCEVFNPDNSAHKTNTRCKLRTLIENGGAEHEVLLGFEQEYTLFHGRNPLGWPEDGYPRPQGPFYCGIGADKAYGRNIVEQHMQYCLDADICLYGINAEVMPGQWEYQVGYRGFASDKLDALMICDHQMLARWLLCRTAEDHNVTVNFENKPVKGDWNGAGCHTNFSTKDMRNPNLGAKTIATSIERLSKKHIEHVELYGHNLHERLTGEHETCSIGEFKSGVSDRGSSIRIPIQVEAQGYGYIEDRRPGANCDPYLVAAALLSTACDINADWIKNCTKAQNPKIMATSDKDLVN